MRDIGLFFFFYYYYVWMKVPAPILFYPTPPHWSVKGHPRSARQKWDSRLPTGSLLMHVASGPKFFVCLFVFNLLCLAGVCFVKSFLPF